MGPLSDSDEKNGNVVTYSSSRVTPSYHLSRVCLLFGIRLLLQVCFFFLSTEQISFFYKKPVMHGDLPWIKSSLASSRRKKVLLFMGGAHG